MADQIPEPPNTCTRMNTWRETAAGEGNVLYCTWHSLCPNLIKLIYACTQYTRISDHPSGNRWERGGCVCQREKKKHTGDEECLPCTVKLPWCGFKLNTETGQFYYHHLPAVGSRALPIISCVVYSRQVRENCAAVNGWTWGVSDSGGRCGDPESWLVCRGWGRGREEVTLEQ